MQPSNTELRQVQGWTECGTGGFTVELVEGRLCRAWVAFVFHFRLWGKTGGWKCLTSDPQELKKYPWALFSSSFFLLSPSLKLSSCVSLLGFNFLRHLFCGGGSVHPIVTINITCTTLQYIFPLTCSAVSSQRLFRCELLGLDLMDVCLPQYNGSRRHLVYVAQIPH